MLRDGTIRGNRSRRCRRCQHIPPGGLSGHREQATSIIMGSKTSSWALLGDFCLPPHPNSLVRTCVLASLARLCASLTVSVASTTMSKLTLGREGLRMIECCQKRTQRRRNGVWVGGSFGCCMSIAGLYRRVRAYASTAHTNVKRASDLKTVERVV